MARTILQIVQDAAPKLGVAVPATLIANTGDTEAELASIAQEVAQRIVRAHDWNALKVLQTYTGDGTTTAYDLPTDYLRMPKDGQVWSSRWQRPLIHVSTDDWLRLEVREYDLVTGTYTILAGQMQFRPALAASESAKWYYVSGNVVSGTSGNAARFGADSDTFRLDDRLLELALIWEWKHRKGLPYEEDMRTAELALAQAIADDRGARMLVQASRGKRHGEIAYPWAIEP